MVPHLFNEALVQTITSLQVPLRNILGFTAKQKKPCAHHGIETMAKHLAVGVCGTNERYKIANEVLKEITPEIAKQYGITSTSPPTALPISSSFFI